MTGEAPRPLPFGWKWWCVVYWGSTKLRRVLVPARTAAEAVAAARECDCINARLDTDR